MPVENEERLIELCRQAVERLSRRLPGTEVLCHLRTDDVLRVVAAEGEFRLIYEIRREEGGIGWRAIESGEPQLVPDVRRDPDYIASDEQVRAEIAVPIALGGEPAVVLDVEFAGRTFAEEEAAAVQDEAAALASALGATAQAS